MSNILLISRPFLNSNSGTGEQAVARNICITLESSHTIHTIKRIVVKPYHSIKSLLFYDILVSFLLAMKNVFVKYDIVIFNSPYQALFAYIFHLRSKTTCIIHDLFFIDYQTRSFFDKYSYLIFKKCLKYCDKLIVTSQETANELNNHFDLNATIVPLGCDLKKYARNMDQITDVTGYIGSYTARKRPEYLLEFSQTLVDSSRTLQLAGIMPESFKNVLSQNTNIKILGELSAASKKQFYQSITFLYFPTSLEGFGMPLVEAMRMSVLPIIHVDAKIPALIKERCHIVQDASDAAISVKRLSSNKVLLDHILKKNAEYSRQFDWEVFARQLI